MYPGGSSTPTTHIKLGELLQRAFEKAQREGRTDFPSVVRELSPDLGYTGVKGVIGSQAAMDRVEVAIYDRHLTNK